MSRDRNSASLDTKIYVGDLPKDATENEIERVFSTYGKVKNVWVARNPSGFAFVEYEDTRDAEDAVRNLDGASVCGVRARVEFSTGKSRTKSWDAPVRRAPPPPSAGRRFNPDDRCYECGERGHYAYDCEMRQGGRKKFGPPSYRRSRSRSRSRRRSRSSSRHGRSRSNSYRRKRSSSRSPRRRKRSRSDSYRNGRKNRSRSRSDDKSLSKSKSRSVSSKREKSYSRKRSRSLSKKSASPDRSRSRSEKKMNNKRSRSGSNMSVSKSRSRSVSRRSNSRSVSKGSDKD